MLLRAAVMRSFCRWGRAGGSAAVSTRGRGTENGLSGSIVQTDGPVLRSARTSKNGRLLRRVYQPTRHMHGRNCRSASLGRPVGRAVAEEERRRAPPTPADYTPPARANTGGPVMRWTACAMMPLFSSLSFASRRRVPFRRPGARRVIDSTTVQCRDPRLECGIGSLTVSRSAARRAARRHTSGRSPGRR